MAAPAPGGAKPSMIIGQKGKTYGLVIPSKPVAKPAAAAPAKRPIFSVDDEDDTPSGNVNRMIVAENKKKQKQAQDEMEKILAEDPNAYDYDGVYESIQKERERQRELKQHPERKARYIEALKAKAAEKKINDDKAYDRKCIREHQAEDHLFGDKEKFVTAAYKKSLEERALWEAAEKARTDREEDVTRKEDISGFYGALLTRNVAFGTRTEEKPAAAPAPAQAPAGAGEGGAAAAEAAGGLTGEALEAAREEIEREAAARARRAELRRLEEERRKAPPPNEKRNDEAAVGSARERYLARKQAAAAGPAPPAP